MKIESQIEKISSFQHLEMLANQIVEGFISGIAQSPFHGFSAEFAEHKVYNAGESTKHIDWKLFAKTDRLYTKKFEEDTNLRCHIIIDNSSSMHYPKLEDPEKFFHNKIGFSVLASAVLMNILKKQRDAVGLSVFSDTYEVSCARQGKRSPPPNGVECAGKSFGKTQNPKKHRHHHLSPSNSRKNPSSFDDHLVYGHASIR